VTAAILEIRDGQAVGPLHQPVETLGRNCHIADLEPLEWTSLCGVRGYVYDRDGIQAYEPALADCFDCLCLLYGGGTAKHKSRLRRAQRKYTPTVRVCRNCGSATSPKSFGLCRQCHIDLNRPAPEHGTRSRYVSGCRCDLCTAAERDYAREYKRERARQRKAAA